MAGDMCDSHWFDDAIYRSRIRRPDARVAVAIMRDAAGLQVTMPVPQPDALSRSGTLA